jgi:hypothetical protein
MDIHRYKESGLDNVLIEGVSPYVDDDGDAVVTVPNIAGLHRTIASAIVNHA